MSKRVSRVCKWCGHKVTFDVEKHDKHIYNKAIDDCLEILYFHQNEYDGIQWAIKEIEELKEMDRD